MRSKARLILHGFKRPFDQFFELSKYWFVLRVAISLLIQCEHQRSLHAIVFVCETAGKRSPDPTGISKMKDIACGEELGTSSWQVSWLTRSR